MGAPYANELRTRVMDSIKSGMPILHAAKLFKLSRDTIYKWKKLQEQNGHLNPKSSYQKGHSHCVDNLEVFKEFIEKNKNKTRKELCELWGKKISVNILGKYLRKINFTYKKNFL